LGPPGTKEKILLPVQKKRGGKLIPPLFHALGFVMYSITLRGEPLRVSAFKHGLTLSYD